jgi:hypothetical protein
LGGSAGETGGYTGIGSVSFRFADYAGVGSDMVTVNSQFEFAMVSKSYENAHGEGCRRLLLTVAFSESQSRNIGGSNGRIRAGGGKAVAIGTFQKAPPCDTGGFHHSRIVGSALGPLLAPFCIPMLACNQEG